MTELIEELRGFAEGSTSARATLMRDAADALENALATTEADKAYIKRIEAENERLGLALFAAYQATGADTDGARTWQELFRPITFPSWDAVITAEINRIRLDADSDIALYESRIAAALAIPHGPFGPWEDDLASWDLLVAALGTPTGDTNA